MAVTLTSDQLLALARRFYPAGVEACSPAYDAATETLHRRAQLDRAGREMAARWAALTSSARDAWPRYEVWDATYLPVDPSFKLRLLTTKRPAPESPVLDLHRITVVLNASALAPVHSIHTVL